MLQIPNNLICCCDSRRYDNADRADEYFREAAQLTRRMLGALPTNRGLLEHIRKNGLPGL